jgi:hypothetical protein
MRDDMCWACCCYIHGTFVTCINYKLCVVSVRIAAPTAIAVKCMRHCVVGKTFGGEKTAAA